MLYITAKSNNNDASKPNVTARIEKDNRTNTLVAYETDNVYVRSRARQGQGSRSYDNMRLVLRNFMA